MSETDLNLLDDHILILGYSDVVRAILDDLPDQIDVLVVSPDREEVRNLTDRGINVFTAEPDDEESLHDVGVERARTVIVATNDDASDALTILTVRQLNSDVKILAVATNRENIKKLERAGATSVVSPAVIAAQQLVQSTLKKDADTGFDVLGEQTNEGSDTA